MLFLLGLMGFLGACRGETQGSSIQFFALDTPCSITFQGTVADDILFAAEAEVQRIEALLSSYTEDSEISILNREGQGILSAESFVLLQKALAYASQSDGRFDPSIGPLSRLWDVTGSRALQRTGAALMESGDVSGNGMEYQIDRPLGITEQRHPPAEKEIDEALSLVSYRNVILDSASLQVRFAQPGMNLDLGGIAKGYAADRIAILLQEAAAPAAVIDLGGNILLYGQKPDGSAWSVGIRGEGNNYLVGMFLKNPKSIVTSGIYQRYFLYKNKRYHHILSSETGYPVDNGIFSVTVLAPSSTDADALSTLLFAYGLERGLEEVSRRQDGGEDIEALFVTSGDLVYGSKGFALLSDSHYNALRRGEGRREVQSKDLPPDKIWLYPLKKELEFANISVIQ